ncbi:MAG TPA: hemerythrin domain-containing protein [Pseudonocardiaceae bacterium]|nr:hemerythrin domain-containing protein [Pseudonocardiaceae bacterium]
MFGTGLAGRYQICRDTLGLSDHQLALLAATASAAQPPAADPGQAAARRVQLAPDGFVSGSPAVPNGRRSHTLSSAVILPRSRDMSDVTLLILHDHETLRRMFAELAGLRDDPTQAQAVWTDLAALLEVHASAEEEHFYPALLAHVPDSADETKDAIGDHDEIRQGIRHAQSAEVGSEEWWKGVEETRDANQEHLAEEERDDLPDCLRHMSLELRTELGERFQEFKDKHPHARGLSGADKDPDRYVEAHQPD